jgi:hypothetical protein
LGGGCKNFDRRDREINYQQNPKTHQQQFYPILRNFEENCCVHEFEAVKMLKGKRASGLAPFYPTRISCR